MSKAINLILWASSACLLVNAQMMQPNQQGSTFIYSGSPNAVLFDSVMTPPTGQAETTQQNVQQSPPPNSAFSFDPAIAEAQRIESTPMNGAPSSAYLAALVQRQLNEQSAAMHSNGQQQDAMPQQPPPPPQQPMDGPSYGSPMMLSPEMQSQMFASQGVNQRYGGRQQQQMPGGMPPGAMNGMAMGMGGMGGMGPMGGQMGGQMGGMGAMGGMGGMQRMGMAGGFDASRTAQLRGGSYGGGHGGHGGQEAPMSRGMGGYGGGSMSSNRGGSYQQRPGMGGFGGGQMMQGGGNRGMMQGGSRRQPSQFGGAGPSYGGMGGGGRFSGMGGMGGMGGGAMGGMGGGRTMGGGANFGGRGMAGAPRHSLSSVFEPTFDQINQETALIESGAAAWQTTKKASTK